jgi:DNA-binding MarR family transcriptional regulator/ribosomal protein S18 acetylase RimI-like enzyme
MNNKLKKDIDIIRGFNRYYTNVLGLLNQHMLKSKFSLSEARVLKEIEKIENCTSKKLSEILCMDAGYLSRILTQFEKSQLIDKRLSSEDARSYLLYLTKTGREKMGELNKNQDEQIFNLISTLSKKDLSNLVQNMTYIEQLLNGKKNIKLEDITIRHRMKAGDIGYITYMHGWIYKEEYNYTTVLEGYVAKSFYDFLVNYNAEKDRLWLAEHNNEIVGSIGIVGHGDRAQLRWFLIHPNYRGLKLGKRLMDEAIQFCKQKDYKTVFLDTTDDLDKAVSMYTNAGFVKISEKENHTWADDLMELELELDLEG